MDRKIMIAIVAIIVIVIAIAAAVAVSSDSDDDNGREAYTEVQFNPDIDGSTYKWGKFTGEARLQVYGNVNNDDYLNSDDLTLLKSIVADDNWNRFTHPLADVNCDGYVNEEDVSHLEDLLNKRDGTLMYYVNTNSYPSYVHYPMIGNIAVAYDYGYQAAQMFGIYDRVVAGINRWVSSDYVSDVRYPGVYDFYNMGDLTVESCLAAMDEKDVHILLGGSGNDVNNALHNAGYRFDYIYMSWNTQRSDYQTPITTVITAAVLLGCEDAGWDFVNYRESLVSEIKSRVSEAGLSTQTFCVPYNPSNYTTTHIDCKAINGSAQGEYWNIVNTLPLVDALPAQQSSFSTVEIEYIMQNDPDIIVISMWGKMTDKTPVSEAQATFDSMTEYFKETNAYKNGKIYGVCYETCGPFFGVSGMKLLASYIWPTVFTEEEGWESLQYFYDTYTLFSGDLHSAGGLLVYKMS